MLLSNRLYVMMLLSVRFILQSFRNTLENAWIFQNNFISCKGFQKLSKTNFEKWFL